MSTLFKNFNLVKIYKYLLYIDIIELIATITKAIALLATLFKPFYIILRNLYYKVYKYTITLINLILPI